MSYSQPLSQDPKVKDALGERKGISLRSTVGSVFQRSQAPLFTNPILGERGCQGATWLIIFPRVSFSRTWDSQRDLYDFLTAPKHTVIVEGKRKLAMEIQS